MYPKLRFKGFDDAWEQRKLSDISERVTRKNKNLEYSLPLTISAQYGLVDQHEFFNKRIAAKDVSGYYVIKNGEFAYNKSYSEGYPWGAVKRLDRYENGVLSTLYILFSVKNVDSDFLVSYYDTNNWHSEVQQRSAEGARNHGLLNISASDFFDTELVIPQDPNEQKKIGLLFKKLDSTITLHQRQCEALKKQKQFFLQNMFPKEGESEPRIRFNGFTEPWEQRKFKDFTKQTGIRNKENLDLEPYSITNETGFVPQKDAHDEFGYMKNTDRSAYSIVSPNSFAYNPARINVGSIGYYKGDKNVIVSSLYEVFQTDKDIDDSFLWIWFKSSNFFNWINKLQEGSVRQYFYYDKLCECKLPVPSLKEQEKIGTFFSKLDNLITLHQRQYEQLVSLKKYLLSKMFI